MSKGVYIFLKCSFNSTVRMITRTMAMRNGKGTGTLAMADRNAEEVAESVQVLLLLLRL